VVNDLPRIAFRNRSEWHEWLGKHHRTSPGNYLVYYKKGSGKASVTYEEAVLEALSFGWIDSTVHAVDGERYMQLFTPRKAGSTWSRRNRERVARLIQEERMTEAGLEKVEAAKRDGSWSMLDGIEDLSLPPDLIESLEADLGSLAHFHSLPESMKKQIVWWIGTAKRPETRKKRVLATVAAASNRIRTFPFPPG
jgi:uncharacterized protein YdeI (YjbR/CyaY-like superfamily)